MSDQMNQVTELLLETGQAHHAAFVDVDGDDPEWPLWYANYLQQRLPPIIGKAFTTSELVYLMIDLERRQKIEEPGSSWHTYYARCLLKQDPDQESTFSNIVYTQEEIPSISTIEMIEVDRAMIEEYQISLTQMMENAGRNLAHLARMRFLNHDPRGKKVIVLAGRGGNGGGALTAARRLANYGAILTVVTSRTAGSFEGIPGHQLEILQRMNIPIHETDLQDINAVNFDLIIDGIIGYSLRGAPQGCAADLIRWANAQETPVLALDVPSGVDGSTCTAYDPFIAAAATMTLALPKNGLMDNNLATAVGELYLADIGVPPTLYAAPALNLEVGPLFARSDILRLK